MNRADLQLYGGISLGIFFLILVIMTVVYIRRLRVPGRKSGIREQDLHGGDSTPWSGDGKSRDYWLNRDDLEGLDASLQPRCYHYFDNIDECIHDLIVEMYDCGMVRTEDIFTAAYGADALTPHSVIYMTDRDGDVDKAYASLPPVSEDNQKIIYDKWADYVAELLDTVELHTSEANCKIIKDALLVYGRKKISILLRSPE